MISTQSYSTPVHRSLLQRELIIGIPQAGLLILLFLGFVFMYMAEMYFMAIPIAILYILMRVLTKKDPYLIDILIGHINEKDFLIP
jgi:type IV secretory pathway VirB3-like protein